jgi:hypothetical protein
MALRTKPQQQSKIEDQRINELIEKGGTVATRDSGSHSKLMLVQLRLSKEVIQRIDKTRKKRTVPPSRHSWILEALLDKLAAE